MAIETDIYTPRTLGKLVRRLPPVRTFLLDTFFRNRKTFATKSIEVDFKKGGRALAPFVHPKVGGRTVPNKGYQTKSYTPVLIAPNKITTVDDLLERSAGENPYSGKKPADRAVEKLAEDLRELKEMIVRREEWMAATAIFTGKIPIIGEGLNEEIDFEFTNEEKIVTDGLKWSADTADPLADLERWHEQVQKNGFVNCNICVMAADVAKAFVRNAKVKDVLDIRAYDLAVIKPRQLPNGLTYIGTINKLGLDIYQYNEWYLDDWTNPAAPEEKPLVPDGALALLSTEAEYSLYYGAITMIPEEGKGFVTVEGNAVPQTWVERRPDRRFLQINSKPLPVPHEVNSWFVAHRTVFKAAETGQIFTNLAGMAKTLTGNGGFQQYRLANVGAEAPDVNPPTLSTADRQRSVVIHSAPVFHVGNDAQAQDIEEILRKHDEELLQEIDERDRQRADDERRRAYD